MVRVLLYGYATGVYSSRKIEARTWENVAFRYLSGNAHPNHDTLAEFRKRHLEALAGLFPPTVHALESPAGTHQLMEEVCERENLKQALQQVKANQGSPGIDGMTVEELPRLSATALAS